MFFRNLGSTCPVRFDILNQSFGQSESEPFGAVLPTSEIEKAFRDADALFGQEEDAVYTPAITLWGFLSQTVFERGQRSCIAAVTRITTLCVALGRKVPSPDSGAYCRACAKLQPKVLKRLTLGVAQRAENEVDQRLLWHGRHVQLADGTSMSMPDTEANQACWPQSSSQKPGLGFPIVRMVFLISWVTGMVCDMAMGPYAGKETGEMALIRQLLSRLGVDDILLADRYYCSFFLIAALLMEGRDFVSQLHHARKGIDESQHDLFQEAEYKKVQRLGKGDFLVTWERPKRPNWMSAEEYASMPESICVRYLNVTVSQPGFRPRKLTVVTTLTDPRAVSKDDVAALYRQRWLVELDIRSIKTTMGADVLRCKSPHMIQNEIWATLLAYNLIRAKQAAAALRAGRTPHEVSFAATMQTIAGTWLAPFPLSIEQQHQLNEILLEHLSRRRTGHRPNRVEPRARKRRPKPHKNLTTPRQVAQDQLISNHATQIV
jgi:putative transposase